MNFSELKDNLYSNAFADGSADSEVFTTVAWFENLAATGFVGKIDVWLPLVLDPVHGGVGCLPLILDQDGAHGLSNYYSPVFGPVDNGLLTTENWKSLANSIKKNPLSYSINLRPLDEDGTWLRSLESELRNAGCWVDRYYCFGNWYYPVSGGDFRHYMASRPSFLKNSIARGKRRLEKMGDTRVSIHQIPGPNLDQAIQEFESVYARSWKAPEPCPQFMPGLLRLAASEGWLRLGVLYLSGSPVAAQVWLVKGCKANIYKLAYLEGLERFSPGSVLTAALMEHVIDVDKVREIDYLTGDDAYKRDWMSHRRERIGLVAFDPLRFKGLLGAARHFGGKGWRWLNSLRGQHHVAPSGRERSTQSAQP